MIIKALVENTSISQELGSEHGLSLYIQTQNHKILFDVGQGRLFYENAQKLHIDIADIDFLVISHGHNDHGGGLSTFLQQNTRAEVFLHNRAFENHYALRSNGEMELIGLADTFKNSKQLILTSDRFFINKGVQLFSNVTQTRPLLPSNHNLLMQRNGQISRDDFAHEQNLIIEEDGKTLLLTGCAHNGIINILEHFYRLKNRMPDYVIGGFHISSLAAKEGSEGGEAIDEIADYLMDTKAKYYTCHCTGKQPYNQLKAVMGERMDYIAAGDEIII